MDTNTEELYNEVLKKIEEITVSEIPNYYEEESLVQDYESDFKPHIKDRGLEYYELGHVMKVFKSRNRYYAKVSGSSLEPYEVQLEVHDDHIDYSCSCPCEYNCKHEYAVLLAIVNKEYEQVTLRKFMPDKVFDIGTILQTIPAEEIKEFVINALEDDSICIDEDIFSNAFRKYLPKQKYDYYYNNLYNELVLNNSYSEKIYDYMECAKEYLSADEFREVFKIIKAIINAYKDSDNLNDDIFIDLLPSLGMYLRIVYRKSDDVTVQMITSWVTELAKNNYYNSYYLEDIILSLK